MSLRPVLLPALLAVTTSCGNPVPSRTRAVYGSDNRTGIARAAQNLAPYASAVALVSRRYQIINTTNGAFFLKAVKQREALQMCADEPFGEEFMLGDCTGFAVGADRLVTARHCIPDQKSCDGRLFIFGHTAAENNSFSEKQVYNCSKIISATEKDAGDLVVVGLDRPVESSAGIKFLRPADQLRQDPMNLPQLYVLGHPFGGSLTAAPLESNLTHEDKYYLRGNADVSQGNSGSPLFDPETGLLYGVLTGGGRDLEWDDERGCNKTHICRNNDCKGEQFSAATNLSSDLPD